MNKQLMVMVVGLLAIVAVSFADVVIEKEWTFEDGTVDGWYPGDIGTVAVAGAGPYFIQNYDSQVGFLLPRVDYGYTVKEGDYFKLDYFINASAGTVGGTRFVVWDGVGTEYYSFLDETLQVWHYGTEVTLADLGISAGTTITGLGVRMFQVAANSIWLDNIQVVSSVPEPMTLGILACGGLLAVLRKRK